VKLYQNESLFITLELKVCSGLLTSYNISSIITEHWLFSLQLV